MRTLKIASENNFYIQQKKLKSLLKIQGFWGRTILGTKVATAGTKNTAVYQNDSIVSSLEHFIFNGKISSRCSAAWIEKCIGTSITFVSLIIFFITLPHSFPSRNLLVKPVGVHISFLFVHESHHQSSTRQTGSLSSTKNI